jgi:hypothetical protein
VTLPAHGQLTLSASGGFSYTPVLNYAGPDVFTYKANDGTTDGNVATVTIQIAQVNDPPITEADAFTAVLNQPLDVPAPGVLRNDHDVEVEDTVPLHAQLVTGPTHGQLTLRADGRSLRAGPDYLGNGSFTTPPSTTRRRQHQHRDADDAIKAVTHAIVGGTTVRPAP